jgi:predicted transcriptional regulator
MIKILAIGWVKSSKIILDACFSFENRQDSCAEKYSNGSGVYLQYRINSRKAVSEFTMWLWLLSSEWISKCAASVRTAVRLSSKTF